MTKIIRVVREYGFIISCIIFMIAAIVGYYEFKQAMKNPKDVFMQYKQTHEYEQNDIVVRIHKNDTFDELVKQMYHKHPALKDLSVGVYKRYVQQINYPKIKDNGNLIRKGDDLIFPILENAGD